MKMQSQTNGNKELPIQINEKAKAKKSKFLIWCHLCRKNIPGYAAFRMHIMKRHRPSSPYYIGHTDCDSSYDEEEDSEDYTRPVQSFNKDYICVDNEIETSEHDHEVETYDCDSEIETSKPVKKLKRNNSDISRDISCDSNEEIYNQDLQVNTAKEAVESLSSEYLKNRQNSSKLLKNSISPLNIQSEVNGSQMVYFNPTMNISPNYNLLTDQASAQLSNPQFAQINNQLFVAPCMPQQLKNPSFVQNLITLKNSENNFEKSTPEFHHISESNTANSSGIQETNDSIFEFNIKNIVSWNQKFEKLCKQLKCPLPTGILKKLKYIQQAIFENCHLLKSCSVEEKKSLLKMYEDLDKIIINHIEK